MKKRADGKTARNQLLEWLQNALNNHSGDGCLEWPFWKNNHGYGAMTVNQKRHYVHRLAYEMAVGHIPLGYAVLHACDNGACFNPLHLHLGTQRENMQECSKRARIQHGVNGTSAKLNELQVRVIRRLCENPELNREAIGKLFGVTRMNINAIWKRQTWRHI